MRPPENFETERLRLRPPVLEDAAAIFEEYAQDPEVTRYLVWHPHKSIEDTNEFLKRCLAGWDAEKAFSWILIRKETNKLIGMVELRVDGFKADFGYVLARNFWRQGLMTDAVQKIIGWTLQQETISRVWATCDVENRASARVLEKVGMKLEGILHRWIVHPNLSQKPRDAYCYAITK